MLAQSLLAITPEQALDIVRSTTAESRMSPGTKRRGGRERRQHLRYPQTGELSASHLSPIAATKARKRIVQGQVKDISAGGVRMLTDQLLKESNLLQCNIAFAKLPAAIPALMEIQWIAKGEEEFKFTVGLRYILVAPGSARAP